MFSIDTFNATTPESFVKFLTKDNFEILRNNHGSKALIFLLYDKNYEHYYEYLTNHFYEINDLAKKEISFWTYYGNPVASDLFERYEYTANMQHKAVDDYKQMNESDPLPASCDMYDCMKCLGTYLKVGNSFPCFVICRMDDFSYISVPINTDPQKDLYSQISELFMFMVWNGFDWEKTYEHYHVDAGLVFNDRSNDLGLFGRADMTTFASGLKKFANITKYGFPKNYLCQLGFNKDVISRYVNRSGYVRVKDFIKHAREFLYDVKNVDNAVADEIINTSFDLCKWKYSSDKQNTYYEIFDFIEESSKNYLRRAESISKSLKNDVDASIVAYCLSKVLEDEINLGYVHLIRKELNVSLPEFYNRYQSGTQATITSKKEDTKKYNYYNYNRKNQNDTHLRYPEISASKKVLFSNDPDFEPIQRVSNIRQDSNVYDCDTVECMRKVSDYRNLCTHSRPLNKDEFSKVEECFKKIVESGFFAKNYKIKQELGNHISPISTQPQGQGIRISSK